MTCAAIFTARFASFEKSVTKSGMEKDYCRNFWSKKVKNGVFFGQKEFFWVENETLSLRKVHFFPPKKVRKPSILDLKKVFGQSI